MVLIQNLKILFLRLPNNLNGLLRLSFLFMASLLGVCNNAEGNDYHPRFYWEKAPYLPELQIGYRFTPEILIKYPEITAFMDSVAIPYAINHNKPAESYNFYFETSGVGTEPKALTKGRKSRMLIITLMRTDGEPWLPWSGFLKIEKYLCFASGYFIKHFAEKTDIYMKIRFDGTPLRKKYQDRYQWLIMCMENPDGSIEFLYYYKQQMKLSTDQESFWRPLPPFLIREEIYPISL